MNFRITSLFVAATLAVGAASAMATPANEPEKLVAPPADAGTGEAYWSIERMDRARIVRPIVLDPETMEPVKRA